MRYNKITVVINTFNSEDKIHQCLKSIPLDVKKIIIENKPRYNSIKWYLEIIGLDFNETIKIINIF